MRANCGFSLTALFVLASVILMNSSGRSALANEPPVAEAGLLRYAATDPVLLDGAKSYDPDNSGPLTYTWTQVSGPPLVITEATTATPTLSGFVQTHQVQECQLQLIVNDGQQASSPDTVKVVIVPDFGPSTLQLENEPFDPNKPTVIYFGGAADGINGSPGQPWGGGAAWMEAANVISFPSGYTPDSGTAKRTYYRYGDMIVAYLSAVAPDYREAIQTIGFSTGVDAALDVGIRLNETYRDPRYAVNRVTGLDGGYIRIREGGWNAWLEPVQRFLANSVDGEQCWFDFYYGTTFFPSYAPAPRSDLLWVQIPLDHLSMCNWYHSSLTGADTNQFNGGVVAGAYWSVIGPGKNLQLASVPGAYYFRWDGGAQKGAMGFFNESECPGRLPEPVTLVGPSRGAPVDPNRMVFSCQPSENAVSYQLLFGADPYGVMDCNIVSDTPYPPNMVITTLPFEETWWTVRVRDAYGSTIYADPVRVDAYVLSLSVENRTIGRRYGYLQAAIDEASDGDEIVLGQGTCHESVDFKGKSLTLRSIDPNDPRMVGATILAGDGKGPVVTLSSGRGEATTLDGLTITGGKVSISCQDAHATIKRCTIGSNRPVAIEFWYGHEPRLIDCTLLGQVREGSDPRLLTHWKLDETAGTIARDSVGGNDATVAGTPLWRADAGKVGGALQLSGAPNFIITRLTRDPSQGSLSVFAWVNGGAPGQVILSQQKGVNWLMAGTPDGTLTADLKSTDRLAQSLTSTTVITDGDWHRVGLSWDGTNRILYVDDVEVARDTQPNLAGSSGNLYLGAGSTMTPASFWKGLLDDVRIYDRAVKP